ncbi:hypothetical protein BGZ54_010100, partial [Gamsiella multidivaricata]
MSPFPLGDAPEPWKGGILDGTVSLVGAGNNGGASTTSSKAASAKTVAAAAKESNKRFFWWSTHLFKEAEDGQEVVK